MRESSGGSWCQCACSRVPECSTGASVQAAPSNWKTGRCRSQRNAVIPSSLLAPSPAPPNLPTSSRPCCFFSWIPSLSPYLCSTPAGLRVRCPFFWLFRFFCFILGILAHQATPVLCVVFFCHRAEGECFNVQFTNDQAKGFLFIVSPKDLLDLWEDIDDCSGSMTKKEPFFSQVFDTRFSCNIYVQRLKFCIFGEPVSSSLISCGAF